jgi:hypothetical protein
MSGDPIVLVSFFYGLFEMLTYFFIMFVFIRMIVTFLLPKWMRKFNRQKIGVT